MSMVSIKVQVRLAWWFKFYVWGLLTTVFVTGLEPDWAKVDQVIKRAIRMRVE